MTSHYTRRALCHFTRKFYRPHVCGRGASTSCSGAGPAALPPPCAPPLRPACRAHPVRSVRAVRVVCCPPATRHRPPCSPHEPRPPITCLDVIAKEGGAIQSSSPRLDGANTPLSCDTETRERCGAEQDRVARRLALGEAVRRREYEREAAKPRERIAIIPRMPYRLGCERECARATDGRDYSIPCEYPDKSPRHCGPARSPPPPRCVELAPDDACRIHTGTGARLDPCAHRPRLLLRIDRSPATVTSTTSNTPTAESDPPHTTSTVSSLKSRIMHSLTQGARPQGSDRLTSKCQGHSSFGRRNYHLSSRSLGNVCPRSETESHPTTKHTGGLDSVLRQRDKLREAGRGRAVCGTIIKKSSQGTGVCGQIELPVPGGARRVRVHVALDDDREKPLKAGAKACAGTLVGGGITRRGRCKACRSEEIIAMTDTRDSWLSIKNLQKKISGYTQGDDATSKKKGSDKKPGGPLSNPCGTPKSAPQPPLPKREPSTKPWSLPTPSAPNKTHTDEKNKPKPHCRYLPISLTAAPVP